MRRRAFITLLGSAPAIWPVAAKAQPSDRPRRVGILIANAANEEVWQPYLAAFKQRLQDLGWVEGRTVRIDYRLTGEDPESIGSGARELTALAPDVILVASNPAVAAVLQITRSIPIVFTSVSDSVGSGFVASLAHPGGKVTGFHNFEPTVGGKWLGLLKEIAPGVRSAAVIHVPDIPANVALLDVIRASSGSLGMTVVPAPIRTVTDIDRVLGAFARPGGGLIVTPSPLTAKGRDVIIAAAMRLSLPAIYPFRWYAARGGLVSYGVDQTEQVREAATYVDRILRGAQPGDLPVQLPTKYELVINLQTAKALGLSIPQPVLLRADDVIQ